MKKKCIGSMLIVGVLLTWSSIAVADSVVGSDHDMIAEGKAAVGEDNVCQFCHVPHNAVGDKIWSNWANNASYLTGGPSSPIGNMCYTCHDGVVTDKGLNTVFNASLQQHKTEPGTDCNICHTVHDNANGKFLGIAKTTSSATESETYCETCHDATQHPDATSYGDMTAGSEHPYKDSGSVLDSSCNSCHMMHGAADYTTDTLTNPILKMDNTDSAYCALCHSGYVQPTTGGTKHPANLSTAGTWGKVGCQKCHDVHQPDATGHLYILPGPNTDSYGCTVCHKETGAADGPDIGSNSHPVGNSFTTVGLTPAGNDIDDNGDAIPDYPTNSANIICESCHSVHKKGVDEDLLRIADDSGELCLNCHNDK